MTKFQLKSVNYIQYKIYKMAPTKYVFHALVSIHQTMPNNWMLWLVQCRSFFTLIGLNFIPGFLGCNLGHEVNDQDSMNIMDFGRSLTNKYEIWIWKWSLARQKLISPSNVHGLNFDWLGELIPQLPDSLSRKMQTIIAVIKGYFDKKRASPNVKL